MKCPKCQFENREGAKFCKECGIKLELLCPFCDHPYQQGSKFCDECGHDLRELTETPPLDYSQPQSYTPKHLKDKILTTRSSIEGERKLVTVFFADVANYTAMSEKLDPEEVHQIMDGFFKILMDEIVHKLGFIPFMLPKLIPLEVMKLMPGYFDSIPEGMYYVCPPPRDSEAFDRFKNLYRITREVSREELKRVVKEPNYVLDPSQCTPLWYFLSHEIVDISLLPFKFYDRSGWTYRWEGGGVEGLVRVQEFRRVELIVEDNEGLVYHLSKRHLGFNVEALLLRHDVSKRLDIH